MFNTEIKIIKNPTDEIIEKNVKKADTVLIIHKKLGKKELKELIYGIIKSGFEPVYVHYYSGKGDFTIGIKKIKNQEKLSEGVSS